MILQMTIYSVLSYPSVSIYKATCVIIITNKLKQHVIISNAYLLKSRRELCVFKAAHLCGCNSFVCMYVCIFITSQIQKSKTSAKLEKQQNYKVRVVNKQASKLCIASQVNQTTDRDDKVHGAIALHLVRAPSLNQLTVCQSHIRGQPTGVPSTGV